MEYQYLLQEREKPLHKFRALAQKIGKSLEHHSLSEEEMLAQLEATRAQVYMVRGKNRIPLKRWKIRSGGLKSRP